MPTKLMPDKIASPQFFCLLLIIGLMFAINSARAENSNAGIPPLTVIKVAWGTIELDKPIWVEIENLGKWAEQPDTDMSKFVLYLDGNPFEGLRTVLRKDENLLGFYLKLSAKSKEAWKDIAGRPLSKPPKEVSLAVGYDRVPVKGSVKSVPININRTTLIMLLVFTVASLILFWWLAYKSDIIRGPGEQPIGADKHGMPNRKPYSLGRTQMAWWFSVVAISYVFIWMLTDDTASLTPSVLALIGISAATGLASATVDSSKRSDQENLLRTLEVKKKQVEAEAERLRSEISTLNATLNATPVSTNLDQQTAAMTAKQGELAAKEKEVEQTALKFQELQKNQEPPPSKGFINDILSDANGISFYRFQMFVWTIVLTVIFITKVYDDLSMPDFDTTLLALMGISGGTYIGFKLPNQQG